MSIDELTDLRRKPENIDRLQDGQKLDVGQSTHDVCWLAVGADGIWGRLLKCVEEHCSSGQISIITALRVRQSRIVVLGLLASLRIDCHGVVVASNICALVHDDSCESIHDRLPVRVCVLE